MLYIGSTLSVHSAHADIDLSTIFHLPLFAGEFGVVYKAHYTEPEGDIGYKTSTVAVKTLKGNLECHLFQVSSLAQDS